MSEPTDWPRFCTLVEPATGRRGRLEYTRPGESCVRWFEYGASPGFAGAWYPNDQLERCVPKDDECKHGTDPVACEACEYERNMP